MEGDAGRAGLALGQWGGPVPQAAAKMAAAVELALLEQWLGLRGGRKYGARGERQVPVLQTHDGPSLAGLSTIAAHLVRQANQEHLLGSTAEEKALVQQWLEYRVTRLEGHASKEDVRTLLKDLNTYLEDRVYLTGHRLTLADALLYYGLHRFFVELTVQEKEKHLNVSRWFCHMQHRPGLRQHLPAVVFVRNRLYAPAP